MPMKFKPDAVQYSRATGKNTVTKYYMKTTPKQELIDYINSSNAKRKVKQKCVNELTRRGVKIVWVPKND